MTPRLPTFDNPPVVEVAVSLQFKPLEPLRAAHFGLIWNRFRKDGYIKTEDHGPLAPTFEEFAVKVGSVGVNLQALDDAPLLPRVWFMNEAKDELIQIQRDRFVVNWRRGAASSPYPRYSSIIRKFKETLDVFREIVVAEELGEIAPTQCELTYVNHLSSGEGWEDHGELQRIIVPWRNDYSDEYLKVPEDVGFIARHRMQDRTGLPAGRLTVALQPAYRNLDKRPIFVLTLTGRGMPRPPDLNGAMQLFDREHEWIVRGFASLTTSDMPLFGGEKTNGDLSCTVARESDRPQK